jgi:hypothetical protein
VDDLASFSSSLLGQGMARTTRWDEFGFDSFVDYLNQVGDALQRQS